MKTPLTTFVFIVIAALIGGVIVAQDQPKPDAKPPLLSEVNRLKLQVISQKIELAQLKAQAAQREFVDAQKDLAGVLKELEVPGWVFEIRSLSYVLKPINKKGTEGLKSRH